MTTSLVGTAIHSQDEEVGQIDPPEPTASNARRPTTPPASRRGGCGVIEVPFEVAS